MRASELLGRTVYDAKGTVLGRIADLVAEETGGGAPRVVAALVTRGRRGRLFGYERPGINGPWLIERFARLLHRGAREIPWGDVVLNPPPVESRAAGGPA
jgi:sporulation protein YlmC with PRC-barrel domain